MVGISSDTLSRVTGKIFKARQHDLMAIKVGLDWKCPSWGIMWHRCYGYWSFGLWPFFLNIEYGKGFDEDADRSGPTHDL